MKHEPSTAWRVKAIDDDFCELIEYTVNGDGEKKSVKTATLFEAWVVHKSKGQKKVIAKQHSGKHNHSNGT